MECSLSQSVHFFHRVANSSPDNRTIRAGLLVQQVANSSPDNRTIRAGLLVQQVCAGDQEGNGDHYPPDTLYSVCSGLLRYILCGVHFALRNGEEHCSLQLSQFELVCPKDGRAHLNYTENYSKNNQEGLLHRKVKPEAVTHYANKSNPNWCLVHFFKPI